MEGHVGLVGLLGFSVAASRGTVRELIPRSSRPGRKVGRLSCKDKPGQQPN